MSAPVCNISPNQSIEQQRRAQQQSQQVGGGTPTLPNIPKAVDLPTTIRAVQNITNIVNQLTGVSEPITGSAFNTRGSQGAAGTSGKPGQAGQPSQEPKNKKARWVEINRQTEKVRVFNEQDHNQYVDIERINLLVMQDTVTGSLWEWKR